MNRKRWRFLILGLMLMLGVTALYAQRPQFQKWNAGVAIGVTDLNGLTGFPTLTGHFRNLTLEVSPYPFSLGTAGTYHLPVMTLFRALPFTLDGTAFFARQNANWYVTFPNDRRLDNYAKFGLLAGMSFYIPSRFCLQIAVGLLRAQHYGPEGLSSDFPRDDFYAGTVSMSLRFSLFKNFQP